MGEDPGLGRMAKRTWTLRRYASESRTLGNSALLTAPIVLGYEVGLLFLGERGIRNAADALIDHGLTAFGSPVAIVVNLLVLAGFVTFALTSAPRKATPIGLFVPVVLESALYACMLAPALMSISRRMIAPQEPLGPLDGLVLSLGAGFYEELVFRLGAIGGGFLLFKRVFGVTSGWAALCLIVVSAAAFSMFHHVGPGAEPFTVSVALMRFVAGLLLGALFVLRGFGVVCYTHVIYDLLCLSGR